MRLPDGRNTPPTMYSYNRLKRTFVKPKSHRELEINLCREGASCVVIEPLTCYQILHEVDADGQSKIRIIDLVNEHGHRVARHTGGVEAHKPRLLTVEPRQLCAKMAHGARIGGQQLPHLVRNFGIDNRLGVRSGGFPAPIQRPFEKV